MSLAQKWLAGLIGLGAITIVTAKDSKIVEFLDGARRFVSGTQHTAMTGKVN